MEITVWRETPSAAASSACDRPCCVRCSRTRFLMMSRYLYLIRDVKCPLQAVRYLGPVRRSRAVARPRAGGYAAGTMLTRNDVAMACRATTHEIHIDTCRGVVIKRFRSWDRREPTREWTALRLLAEFAPGLAATPVRAGLT